MKTNSEVSALKNKIKNIVKDAKTRILDEIKTAKYIGQADDWVDHNTGDIEPSLSKKSYNEILRYISETLDEKFGDVMRMDLIRHGIVTTYDLITKEADGTKRYLEAIRKDDERMTELAQRREALKKDPEYKTFLKLQKKFKIL